MSGENLSSPKDWRVLIDALSQVKSIDPSKVQLGSFVGKDLGLDSIGIVDLWFEIRGLTKHDDNLNAFYRHIRSQPQRKEYNDFTIQELAEYLKLPVHA